MDFNNMQQNEGGQPLSPEQLQEFIRQYTQQPQNQQQPPSQQQPQSQEPQDQGDQEQPQKRIKGRPSNNIYADGTGKGTGRTAIRTGTRNRDGTISPVSGLGAATGSLSQPLPKLLTPRQTPASAYQQRQGNVSNAKANGSFDGIRDKFNSTNSDRIMDEQGNISTNPNAPPKTKFDQVPDGQGGYKMVPVPPKPAALPGAALPTAATEGHPDTIKAGTKPFGTEPTPSKEDSKPLVPPVLGPSPLAVPPTSSEPSSSSSLMPSTGTLQVNTQPISGPGSLGQLAQTGQNIPFKIPGRARGGPIKAGKPYLVGEKGPEIVIPKHGGTVVPNHAITAATLMEMKRAGKKVVLPKGVPGAKFFEERPAPQRRSCKSL